MISFDNKKGPRDQLEGKQIAEELKESMTQQFDWSDKLYSFRTNRGACSLTQEP